MHHQDGIQTRIRLPLLIFKGMVDVASDAERSQNVRVVSCQREGFPRVAPIFHEFCELGILVAIFNRWLRRKGH